MSGERTAISASNAFTVRLLEELKKRRGTLKIADTRAEEAQRRKKLEWQKISELLNTEFGTAHTVNQLYHKAENVKFRVRKKLETLRSTDSERMTTTPPTFSIPEQYFLENMMDGADLEPNSQTDDNGDEDQNQESFSQSANLADSVGVGATVSQLKLLQAETEERSLSPNATGARDLLDGMTSSAKRARLSSTYPLPAESPGLSQLPETNAAERPRASSLLYEAPVTAFTDKVVSCLSKISAERMQEIQRIVKHEMDVAYAQQLEDEIATRFDESHRDSVMSRVLEVLMRK